MDRNEVIESWVHQYADRLAFIAYTHVRDQKLAEDIVQETFIRAFRSMYQLRDKDNPVPWLIRIAVNLCHSVKRKKWNEVVGEDASQQSTSTGPEDIYLERTRDRELHQAIMSLPEKYRNPIILFYFEDLSIIDIAKALNLHGGTVRTRLARGRKQLEVMLERGLKNEQSHIRRTSPQR